MNCRLFLGKFLPEDTTFASQSSAPGSPNDDPSGVG